MYRHYIRVPERSQGVNTAGKMRAVEECSCGKFYSSPEGAAACQANKHGSGKDAFGDKERFLNTIEHEYSAECAECGERLRFRIIQVTPLRTIIDVLPHVCAVDEGEV